MRLVKSRAQPGSAVETVVINAIHPFTRWENRASCSVTQPTTDDARFPDLLAGQGCRRNALESARGGRKPSNITSCVHKKGTIVCLLGLW